MSPSELTERQVSAATLASLPRITPARLRRLFERFGGPQPALEAVIDGRGSEAVRGDRAHARDIAIVWARAADPDGTRAQLVGRGTRVWIDGDADAPILEEIPGRPPVLFGEGCAPDAFAAKRVAIVGTRSATPNGLADAREIGAFLAAAGITVVSGLALGIDGAAHEGTIAGGGLAIGVVATGLDVTYPRRHRALYGAVREHGLIVSEHGYGVQPHAAQFPVRNRIIAALCDACVVVEATASGGASITANYANDYGRVVFALPGARRNLAAAGCNALIKDGAQLLLDPGDILIELGRGRAGDAWQPALGPAFDPDEAAALAALGGEPASVDQLVGRTAMSPGRMAGVLRRLEQAGHIEKGRGRWWPR